MTELIQYLMAMGMPPDAAAAMAARLAGPQMRNDLELGPAEVTPLHPKIDMQVESVRRAQPVDSRVKGPVAAGRTLHAFGMNERDSGDAAAGLARDGMHSDYMSRFLQMQYGMDPQAADMYARRLTGPDAAEFNQPLRGGPRGALENPLAAYYQYASPGDEALKLGGAARKEFRNHPTFTDGDK